MVHEGNEEADVRWLGIHNIEPSKLALDHGDILKMAIQRIVGKIDYAPVIAEKLLPKTWTAADLRMVHEVIKGTQYDPSNFRRRLRRMLTDGTIEVAEGKRQTGPRPATVYRFVGYPW